jgi:hypothetical protein
MANEAGESVSPAIDSRLRLVRWFDDARNRREAARRTGTGRQAIAEITARFRGAESGEETVYLFPGHRAIYEIRIPPGFFRL